MCTSLSFWCRNFMRSRDIGSVSDYRLQTQQIPMYLPENRAESPTRTVTRDTEVCLVIGSPISAFDTRFWYCKSKLTPIARMLSCVENETVWLILFFVRNYIWRNVFFVSSSILFNQEHFFVFIAYPHTRDRWHIRKSLILSAGADCTKS